MKTQRASWSSWPAVLLILAIALFYLGTIKPGHTWGGDFALYILHARNIVQGADYGRTGYVQDRFKPDVAPRAYPPGFPFLLAPTYAIWGLNITIMKVEVIIFFFLALIVLFLLFRGLLPPGQDLLFLALVGLNPILWSYKDRILSDYPFLFFLSLTLWVREGMFLRGRDPGKSLGRPVLCGLLAAACFSLRTVGLILIPVFLIQDILSVKRLRRATLATMISFGVFIVPLLPVLKGTGSHLAQVKLSPLSILKNLAFYADAAAAFWGNGRSRIVAYGLAIVVTALAVFGYRRLKTGGRSVFEVFFWTYLAGLIALPIHQPRYLFPLVPLFVLCVLRGLRELASRPKAGRALAAGLLGMIALSYGSALAGMGLRTPVAEGPYRPESAALFEFIQRETGPDAVVIFRKPTVMALYGGRRSSVYHEAPDGSLWGYFREIGATHIVVSRMLSPDQELLAPFVARGAERLEEIYANPDFKVYRIKGLSAGRGGGR